MNEPVRDYNNSIKELVELENNSITNLKNIENKKLSLPLSHKKIKNKKKSKLKDISMDNIVAESSDTMINS